MNLKEQYAVYTNNQFSDLSSCENLFISSVFYFFYIFAFLLGTRSTYVCSFWLCFIFACMDELIVIKPFFFFFAGEVSDMCEVDDPLDQFIKSLAIGSSPAVTD